MTAVIAGCGGTDEPAEPVTAPAPPIPPPSALPIQGGTIDYPVEASGRHFVDQAGEPVLLAADTAWNLSFRLTEPEMEHYLDARASQGFNTVLVSLVPLYGLEQANRVGETLLVDGDIGRPNPAYFDTIDQALRLAEARGMQLLIVPLWLNIVKDEPSFTVADVEAYGAWLAERYRDRDNIIWAVGGDYGDEEVGEFPYAREVRALATSIKRIDASHLMTYHPGAGLSSSSFYADDAWLDFNSSYWDFDFENMSSAHLGVLQDRDSEPVRPALMLEPLYEGPFPEDETPSDPTWPWSTRTMSWYSMLGGAAGYVYGADSTYLMDDENPETGRTWRETLTIPGAVHQTWVGAFFRGLPWSDLVPVDADLVLARGAGSFEGNDRAVVARSSDEQLLVIYIPSGRQLSVREEVLVGNARVEWFDPTSGARTSAPSPGDADLTVTTPTPNDAGDTDVVLVIDGR